MKWLPPTILLSILGFAGCSGPVACGAVKRLMYEEPWRDRWQRPDEVVRALALEPGDHVADLGAGGGYFTFPIARAVGPEGHVYAIDVDTSLLAYVDHQARKRDLPQIETVHAPDDGMGLGDGAVDLVFLSNVFHHLPDPTSYFEKARRVLRPDGRLAVVEHAGKGFPSGHATTPAQIREQLDAAGYELVTQHDFLEKQSFQVFRPRIDASGSR